MSSSFEINCTYSDDVPKNVSDVDESYRRDLLSLFRELRSHALSNVEFFRPFGGREDSEPTKRRFYVSSCNIHEHLERGIQPGVEYLLSVAYLYDLDESTRANGYRSVVYVVERCCRRLVALTRHISCNRESLLFRSDYYSRELEAYVTTLGQLRACLYYIHKLLASCQLDHNRHCRLFPLEVVKSPEDRYLIEQITHEVNSLSQESFYGRCLGFQFCESMLRPLTTLNLVLASVSEGYERGSVMQQVVSTMISGGKYFLDPDSRGRQVVRASRDGGIDVCKAAWSILENSLMQKVPVLMCPPVEVDHQFIIDAVPFDLPHVNGVDQVTITVPCAQTGPGPVRVRLISHHVRSGQDMLLKRSSNDILPKSPGLIIHCHGGGFVAQSSASHMVYLRQWAVDCTVPILCVDYSLAPEHTFPRQLEEIFFAYCWAIKNCNLLGSTASRVCIVGDSAGGNLAVSTTMRALSFGVRAPDAILSVYGCMIVKFTPSPSRLLSLLDPLLPLGIMIKCLEAYAGASQKEEPPSFCYPMTSSSADKQSPDVSSSHAAPLSESDEVYEVQPEADSVSRLAALSTSDDSGFADSLSADNTEITGSSRKPSRKTLTLNFDAVQRLKMLPSMSKSTSTPMFATPVESPSQLDATRKHTGVFSTPTYAKIRHFAQSPFWPFGHLTTNVTCNPYMSPLLASDDLLAEMCPVYLVTCHLDPFLDDSVSFAERLRSLGRHASLDVFDGLPHGFLHFALVSPEAKAACDLCVRRLKHILEIS